MKFTNFLTPEDEKEVSLAIAAAERNTSGEIRVHIDKNCKGDPLDRAKSLFQKLDMHQTQFRNGVLIYISIDDHKLAIFGDEGIYSTLDADFWQYEIDILTEHFGKGHYLDGLVEVVSQIGKKLKENFPFEQKGDLNELDNEISYGEEK